MARNLLKRLEKLTEENSDPNIFFTPSRIAGESYIDIKVKNYLDALADKGEILRVTLLTNSNRLTYSGYRANPK